MGESSETKFVVGRIEGLLETVRVDLGEAVHVKLREIAELLIRTQRLPMPVDLI